MDALGTAGGTGANPDAVKGRLKPVVDFSRCEAKALCAEVCPTGVFEIRKMEAPDFKALSFLGKIKNRIHGGRVAYTPRWEACIGCGLCVTACPEKAVRLTATGE